MEPLRKRHRLYSPIRNQFLRTFSREQGYDVHEPDELQIYEDLGKPRRVYEDDDDDDDETIDPVPDPDSELQQKRSQLDYKLKTTFESIFERYGKDFEGIGDEIDLATGRIVVDNGHLSRMEHERDAGSRLYDESTEYTEESVESSLGGDEMLLDYDDDEEDEEVEVEEAEDSYSEDGEDDEMEDDLILRGFAKAAQNIQPELVLQSRRPPSDFVEDTRDIHKPHQPAPTKVQTPVVPSHSDFLAQFGPELGAQIHQYISEQHLRKDIDGESTRPAPNLSIWENSRNQHDVNDPWRIPHLPSPSREQSERELMWQNAPPKQHTNNVQPAWRVPELPPDRNLDNRNDTESRWRVPELPTAAPRPRPDLNMSIKPLFKRRRTPPVAVDSVWAEPEKERRNNPRAKNPRNFYTVEDDHILLDCVRKASIRGITMNREFWEGLAAQYPRHPYRSWKQRYEKKYSYLEPDEIGELESTTTTNTESPMRSLPPRLPSTQKTRRNFLETSSPQRPLPVPSRLIPKPVNNQSKKLVPTMPPYVEKSRQPTQQDSRVITWSRAVDATESPVPDREIEDFPDARQVIGSILGGRRHSQSEFKTSTRRIDENRRLSDQSLYSNHNPRTINDHQRQDQPQRQIIDLTETHSEKNDGPATPPAVRVKPSAGTAPCPHTDCKSYPSRFYRLDRRIEEDSSEMAVHLFEDHRTTAFPCGELNCPYVGENGYFTQFELVEHVKSAHPNDAALRRLQGRVSSDLLQGTKSIDDFWKSSWNSPGINAVAHTHQNSDYDSPRIAQNPRGSLSSQRHSSGSDMDRTLTPRGMAGTSMYTPMTSVSSLMVNHSSAHSDPGDGLNQDRSSLPVVQTTENHPIEATPSISKDFGSIREPSIVEDELPSRKDFKVHYRDSHLPDAQQSFSSTAGILGSDGADSVGTDRTDRAHYIPSSVVDKSSPPRLRSSLRSSLRNSLGSRGTTQKSREPAVPEHATPKNITKKTIDSPQRLPSPVEDPVIPKAVSAARHQPPHAESLPKQMFKTPSRKGRTIPPSSAVEEDDELNLAADGFILLSSKPGSRKMPLQTPVNIKREQTADVVDVAPSSSVPAKKTKRKLNQFLDDDDIDELTADSPMHHISLPGPSSKKKTKVKTEEELGATGTQSAKQENRTFKQPETRKAIRQPRSAIAKSSGRKPQTPQSAPRLGPVLAPVRTTTPLLDLTPAKKKGVHANKRFVAPDSAAGSSSRVNVPATNDERSSSPMEGLLITPSGKSYRKGSVEIKQEVAVPVVIVRTPQGTLKKCGENGFACKKSFCFRCGKSRLGVS